MRIAWFFARARAVASASESRSCADATDGTAIRHTPTVTSLLSNISSTPFSGFQAGFLQPRVDVIGGLLPERLVGRYQRQNFSLRQVHAALEQPAERVVRVLLEVLAERLVGQQLSNHHFDRAL